MLQATFEYSYKLKSISSLGKLIYDRISYTSCGHTCIKLSISGIFLPYETDGGCLFLWISPTELIQDTICFGFFYALSILWILLYLSPLYCFKLFIIIKSIFALSDWFKAGSSYINEKFTTTWRPRT